VPGVFIFSAGVSKPDNQARTLLGQAVRIL